MSKIPPLFRWGAARLGPEPVIEVRTASGLERYEGAGGRRRLASLIAEGCHEKTAEARSIPAVGSEGQPKEASVAWSTLEQVCRGDFRLRTLYQPVWTHTLRGMLIGVVVMILLKAVDTTVLFFAVDERLGFMWLLVAGSLLVSNWIKIAPLIAIFICLKAGVGLNLFAPLLGVMAVGAAFGAPIGMLIGSVVGYIRRGFLPRAPDAAPEGAVAFTGLVLPLALLAAVGYVYFMIFQPWAERTLLG